MNRKISRNEKQVLKRRKLDPWWKRKCKRSNKYCQEDDSNIFELLQNL